MPEDQQTGERLYADTDIDRGNLVRRASAVWGDTRAKAEQANEDAFHYTSADPQAAKFNQGIELWLGLETYLQENAADNSRRIIVFTGPIFDRKDPVYRGVDIPMKFFKVASYRPGRWRTPAMSWIRHPSWLTCRMCPGRVSRMKLRCWGHSGPFRCPSGTSLSLPGWTWISWWPWTACQSRQSCPARVTSTWRELHSPEDLDLDFDLGM